MRLFAGYQLELLEIELILKNKKTKAKSFSFLLNYLLFKL